MDARRNAKPQAHSLVGTSTSSDSETPRIERRAFPRVEMTVSALVKGKSGASGICKLLNLSRGGAAIALDRKNGLKVFPAGQITPGEAVSLRFDLPDAAETEAGIDVGCRVVWSRCVGDDLYVVGLEFEAFQGDSSERVEQYIIACMRFE